MRNGHDVVIPATREIPQGAPGLLGTSGQLLDGGLKLAFRAALVGPVVVHTGELDTVAKLGGELVGGGACVAGSLGDLLEDVKGGDGVEAIFAEGVDAGVDGAAEGGGDEAGDVGMVGEGCAEGGALLDAEGGEVRVVDGFIGDGEVVDTLGVADEVDGWGHDERESE